MRPYAERMEQRNAGPRSADEDDYPAIRALWNAAFVDSEEGARTHEYAISDVIATAEVGHLYVVDGTDDLAAVVGLVSQNHLTEGFARRGEAMILRLAVAANQRRRGLARLLLSHCHQLAVDAGCQAVVLWSRPSQVAAHALYQSLGYIRVPERDGNDPDGARIVFAVSL
jgi:ribosomal protein S18 acetylase RimI-like enzyme